MDSGHPAKRRKPSPREIGLMRKPSGDGAASFLGSSSGIHFIRIVYSAFARRSAHLSQAQQQAQKDLVPGEDDQLQSATAQVKNELWTSDELDHRSKRASFEDLVAWTRSYFQHWHPLFPYILGPSFLATLEQISARGLSSVKNTDLILVRSLVSISLMDRRQTPAPASTPVPSALVFRTVAHAMESLHSLFCDPPSIPILQAAFSVELFLAAALRLNAASRIGGAVTRIAFHLGLHRCPSRFKCFSADDAAVRRRLFWSIYCLERYLSQALGIPLSIRDDDVDVCYPGVERHGEVDDDKRLTLITHMAKFARVRGLIIELRNKSILHSAESSITATQVTGELTHWWNEVYDDVYGSDLSPLHRLLLTVLRHESIISLNRPLLAAEGSAESRTALQVCIEASRSLITALGGVDQVPLVWPSFTWTVWMSCLILVHAAWEGEFPVEGALRYAKSGLKILTNLSHRGSTWPQTCIEAISALETALTPTFSPDRTTPSINLTPNPPSNPDLNPINPLPLLPHAPPTLPESQITLENPPDTNRPTAPAPAPNSSVIFGDSTTFSHPISSEPFLGVDMGGNIGEAMGMSGGMSGIGSNAGWGDGWSVADGPWMIQESYDLFDFDGLG